jgi:hypothetical protein
MAVLIYALIPLIAGLCLRTAWVNRQRKKVGYFTTRNSRDSIQYSELINGKFESIIIDGSMLTGGPPYHLLYIPTENEWNTSKPNWAQNRMPEIVERIKEEFPDSENEYSHA